MALGGGRCLPMHGDDLGVIQGNPIPAKDPLGCPQGRDELGFLSAKCPNRACGATVLLVWCPHRWGAMRGDFSSAVGLQESLFLSGVSDPASPWGVTWVGGMSPSPVGLAAAFQTLHGNRLPDAGV